MLKPTRNKRRIAALAGALALSTCLALGLAGCANSEGNGAAEPTAPATEQEANADAPEPEVLAAAREAVAAAAPQVIIDTGEAKKGAKEDLDALQEQLGIPVIFIEAKLSDYGAAYERLGELLGMEERGSELSTYCTDVYNMTVTTMENIPENERVRMAYLLGDNGLNAIAKTSFQAAVVDMVADNVVVVDDVSGKGNGNEISLEQIALWNPDLIVFQTGSIYDTVGNDPAWKGIAAIDSGNYYQVPNVPYCWLNNPPTVNQLMGLQWLPRLLYPDAFDDSIEDVTRTYFHTMYHYDLTDAELADLLKDATGKA